MASAYDNWLHAGHDDGYAFDGFHNGSYSFEDAITFRGNNEYITFIVSNKGDFIEIFDENGEHKEVIIDISDEDYDDLQTAMEEYYPHVIIYS